MGRPAPYAALPWFWSDQGKYKLQIAGLAAPDDEAVLLETARGGQIVVRSRHGLVTAVETVNAPAAHMSARRLLANGPARDLAVSI